jgi:molybdopterin/thiamine biosynthesis adenylyltransferase
LAGETRYSRNELLFGAEGQKRIAGANVGIIGLGGLGSHIAQQLAYLGVLDFALVDDDDVTESSLNRLIGVTPDDINTKKVAVAERLIKTIQPEAKVVPVQVRLPADEAFEALTDRTHLFGCLDRETPRLALTGFSSQHQITYIDTASDVDEGEYGGRIVIARGDGCLFCLGLIDQDELRREGLTPEQQKAHDESYGVRQEALDQAGPSVVSVNGAVSSLALTEFMVHVTEMAEPVRNLNYRGRLRALTRPEAEPDPNCPYCSRWPRS